MISIGMIHALFSVYIPTIKITSTPSMARDRLNPPIPPKSRILRNSDPIMYQVPICKKIQ
jgi:hypothetical protein